MWLPLACPPLGTWLATQACALTGNRTSDPLGHSPTLNPLSYTSQSKLYNFLKNMFIDFRERKGREKEKGRGREREREKETLM